MDSNKHITQNRKDAEFVEVKDYEHGIVNLMGIDVFGPQLPDHIPDTEGGMETHDLNLWLDDTNQTS